MNKVSILNQILDRKVVAIVRMDDPIRVAPVIEALQRGGVQAIEVTMGTPRALQHIEQFASQNEMLMGAGSVLDAETARLAILAGARFLVTPVSKASVIEVAQRYQVPIFSGAFTPGEILQAHEWGADVVKIFPADTVGMDYLKAVKAPMPQLQLMPTGGVTLDNAADWIRHGACCLGMGSALTDKKAIKDGQYDVIEENARTLLRNLGVEA
uniref:Bifunctional 4-hydroxy-2-oxoglutarate aldolase/2-dehydro-3-deoxy-phosphogluconate aldolase n=1 Tax=Roseihalotalea indica TaxID=2867963 RepID=A0AA49GMB2_9BACT|nr:bifunctional 4-hydroxy-2-oxoglutarate aldolase/2-dehydro-3-deoxy-phosphogluconate aldolase [Tunicatimonas sp. TK19036]